MRIDVTPSKVNMTYRYQEESPESYEQFDLRVEEAIESMASNFGHFLQIERTSSKSPGYWIDLRIREKEPGAMVEPLRRLFRDACPYFFYHGSDYDKVREALPEGKELKGKISCLWFFGKYVVDKE